MRMTEMKRGFLTAFAVLAAPAVLFGDSTIVRTNPPSECISPDRKCDCDNRNVSAKCIKASIGLGETTPWTGSLECALKIFADNESPSIFTPESLHAVLGGYTFKRLGQKTMADGVTPAEVVFSHPLGGPVHFVFREGESWGRPDPGAMTSWTHCFVATGVEKTSVQHFDAHECLTVHLLDRTSRSTPLSASPRRGSRLSP